jgi:hypothetical protein
MLRDQSEIGEVARRYQRLMSDSCGCNCQVTGEARFARMRRQGDAVLQCRNREQAAKNAGSTGVKRQHALCRNNGIQPRLELSGMAPSCQKLGDPELDFGDRERSNGQVPWRLRGNPVVYARVRIWQSKLA